MGLLLSLQLDDGVLGTNVGNVGVVQEEPCLEDPRYRFELFIKFSGCFHRSEICVHDDVAVIRHDGPELSLRLADHGLCTEPLDSLHCSSQGE